MITLSTNVVPKHDDEKDALTEWMLEQTHNLFGRSFEAMNGTVLKPPGTRNYEEASFPDDHKIISVRSKISVEQGAAQRGQVHAHVILEVAHKYLRQEDGATGFGNDNGKPHVGVHVNVEALRNYLNSRIGSMNIEDDRKPSKIYVNCKLLTKGTDNSNKWLTVQYINKDRAKDNDGGIRNLREDERNANNPEDSVARQNLLRAEQEFTLGVGGALEEGDVFRPVPAPSMVKTTVSAPTMRYTTAPAPTFVRTTASKQPKKF